MKITNKFLPANVFLNQGSIDYFKLVKSKVDFFSMEAVAADWGRFICYYKSGQNFQNWVAIPS